MQDFAFKHFNELTNLELYLILQLRQEVFVVEQDCLYQDLDNKDLQAFHFFLIDQNVCAATCRILSPGISYAEYASIGRVVVDKGHRGISLGKSMMEKAIILAQGMWPNHTIKISAQAYLQKFYESLGFVHTGESYLEDNIPHIGMKLV